MQKGDRVEVISLVDEVTLREFIGKTGTILRELEETEDGYGDFLVQLDTSVFNDNHFNHLFFKSELKLIEGDNE